MADDTAATVDDSYEDDRGDPKAALVIHIPAMRQRMTWALQLTVAMQQHHRGLNDPDAATVQKGFGQLVSFLADLNDAYRKADFVLDSQAAAQIDAEDMGLGKPGGARLQ